MAVKAFTTDNFKQEISGDKPVLVDFWAEWCGPCKVVSPIVEEIAKEQGDKLKVGKLNTDENVEIAQQYNVMSIPTLILFKDGEPVETVIGAQPKSALDEKFKPHLG